MRVLVALLAMTTFAMAHPPYKEFYKNPDAPVGQRVWCCNGDLAGQLPGDCSVAEYKMVQGGALFMPRRYPGAQIFVPMDEIIWGGPPDPEALKFEAHYCGSKRTSYSSPPSPKNPDPAYHTICASIWPGGT